MISIPLSICFPSGPVLPLENNCAMLLRDSLSDARLSSFACASALLFQHARPHRRTSMSKYPIFKVTTTHARNVHQPNCVVWHKCVADEKYSPHHKRKVSNNKLSSSYWCNNLWSGLVTPKGALLLCK